MVNHYYYVIVGGGLAGYQLALALSRDIFFQGKSIAIIDPAPQPQNDKTWCFWEKGEGKWENFVQKQWQKGKFVSSSVEQHFSLLPYSYKMIKSSDFFAGTREELENAGNIDFVTDEISQLDPVTMKASGKENDYTATHFFDSRIPEDYHTTEDHTKIYQHFKGWIIEAEKNIFDPEVFTMMDFRLKYEDTTSFTYVLPMSPKKALVEFTFFTPFLTDEAVYDEMLKRYILELLGLSNYSIKEAETGVIPMTDFPFHQYNTKNITRIGTGGGWVKASTGYSFKNTERKISQLISNVKKGAQPGKHLINKKFFYYDSIFLDVLANNNSRGEDIFEKFYTRNSPEEIFAYLDEKAPFPEDLKLMLSLFSFDFVKSFFKKIF